MGQQIFGGSCIVEFDDDAETSEVLGDAIKGFKNAVLEGVESQYKTWAVVAISHNFVMINSQLHLTMMIVVQVS